MKPADYQIDAAGHVFERDSSMVFARVGAGKTLAYLMAMRDWKEEGIVKRTLVTAPLRVVKSVWRQEREKWQIPLTMALCTGEMDKDYQAAAIAAQTDVLLVNNDMFDRVIDSGEHGCDAVVFDELSKWRNPTGKRAKLARRTPFKIRSGGTGTPAPNSLDSIYGMCHTVGLGHLVGRNFDKWRRKYFYPTDFQQYDWAPFPHTQAELAALIKPYTYVLENNAVELPPIVKTPITVELPPELREIYNRLRATSELSDYDIVAGSAGVLHGKLRQVAAGFAYRNNAETVRFDEYRLNALADLVDEMNGEPLIVAYEFREQLAMLQRRWPGAPYLGGGSRDDDKTIADWNAGRLPLMFLHAAAAGHGLNLQQGGNAIAWLQLPWDAELYEQTLGRLSRRGQTGASVWSYEICAANTLDVAVEASLFSKMTTQDGLWEELRALGR